MRFLSQNRRELAIALAVLVGLSLFVGTFVNERVQVVFFFAAVYIIMLGYLLVDRFMQARENTGGDEQPSQPIRQILGGQIKDLISHQKLGKELSAAVVLPLSFIIAFIANLESNEEGAELIGLAVAMTLPAIAYYVVRRVRRIRNNRNPVRIEFAAEAQPKGMRKGTKRIIISVLILFVLIILVGATVPEVVIVMSLLLASAGTILYLVIDRFVQKSKVDALTETSLRAEVDSLKAQINPHFFFNTLNNLYGLAVEKSELAPQVILKLSDMMRYTIYEGEKDRVLLKDEIAYLENFIELNRIRVHREVDIKFEQVVGDADLEVPPLLLIILLENAFKHGMAALTDDAFIHISLEARAGYLLFVVKNNFDASQKDEGGIGLKNLRRRLMLLFPDNHSLSAQAIKENVYEARLELRGL